MELCNFKANLLYVPSSRSAGLRNETLSPKYYMYIYTYNFVCFSEAIITMHSWDFAYIVMLVVSRSHCHNIPLCRAAGVLVDHSCIYHILVTRALPNI